MPNKMKFLLKAGVFLFFSLLFTIASSINESKTDPYLTDKYYHSWLESLSEKADNGLISIDSVYQNSIDTIKSPEPLTHLIAVVTVTFLSLNPDEILFFFSIVLILLLSFATSTKKNIFLFQCLIMLFITCMSFYWFVLFNITHRLKLAIIIVVFAFIIAKKNTRLGAFVLTLAVFTHYSVFLIIPLLYLIDNKKYTIPLESGFCLISDFSLLLFLMAGFIYFNADVQTLEFINTLINSKLTGGGEYFILFIVVVWALCKYYESVIIYKYRTFIVVSFYILIFYLIGFSRLLMLVHITFTLICFFNVKILSLSKGLKFNVIVAPMLTVFIYDVAKMLLLYQE